MSAEIKELKDGLKAFSQGLTDIAKLPENMREGDDKPKSAAPVAEITTTSISVEETPVVAETSISVPVVSVPVVSVPVVSVPVVSVPVSTPETPAPVPTPEPIIEIAVAPPAIPVVMAAAKEESMDPVKRKPAPAKEVSETPKVVVDEETRKTFFTSNSQPSVVNKKDGIVDGLILKDVGIVKKTVIDEEKEKREELRARQAISKAFLSLGDDSKPLQVSSDKIHS